MKKIIITIIKWILTIAVVIASIAAFAIIAMYVTFYAMYGMILAVIIYGGDTVMKVTVAIYAAGALIFIIRKLIKRHNKRKVYKAYGRN